MEQRERWIEHLQNHKTNNILTDEHKIYLQNWVRSTRLSKEDLDNIIIEHARYNKKMKSTCNITKFMTLSPEPGQKFMKSPRKVQYLKIEWQHN